MKSRVWWIIWSEPVRHAYLDLKDDTLSLCGRVRTPGRGRAIYGLRCPKCKECERRLAERTDANAS